MKCISLLIACTCFGAVMGQTKKLLVDQQPIVLSTNVLKDKIKGGWAGQTIGVTYGGPYEFRYLGKMIPDTLALKWPEGTIKRYFDQEPGLYDDIYMDLSFVDVIEKYGVDAPVDSFANAFARADYPLWHANQAGRYNILHGIKAPLSGHWSMNPHADDIDFQIEADFAGLMHPGMANSSSKLCDKVGHIMNYGDGYFGGVFMAALYTQAFVMNDISMIISQALKTIPKQSDYYRCMQDVIDWHKMYPNDWQKTWALLEKKWIIDYVCTDGALAPFDISARINSAYVIMGLLYGKGDFAKTMEIAIRCGQDADCNPSSAAGVLGTIIGYDKIPELWKQNLKAVEDRDFVYTNISLNKMYALGFKHTTDMIRRNGGSVKDAEVRILYQEPKPVKMELSFPNYQPVERKRFTKGDLFLKDTASMVFEGTGITVNSGMTNEWNARTDHVFKVQVDLDGKQQIIELPYHFLQRKNELLSVNGLKQGKHVLKLKLLNPDNRSDVVLKDAIIYAAQKK